MLHVSPLVFLGDHLCGTYSMLEIRYCYQCQGLRCNLIPETQAIGSLHPVHSSIVASLRPNLAGDQGQPLCRDTAWSQMRL
jgi:hypothetical protein